MESVKIGITSPLIGNESPSPDMGVTRHGAALERAGATPIILRNDMLPLSVIERLGLSGLIFSGGGDIAAGSYGGNESLVRSDVDFRRDAFEFALMEQALEIGLPILAACRGMQLANVMLDGTLIEDLRHHMGPKYHLIHDQEQEASLPNHAYAHDVIIARGTLLYEIVGVQRFPVNSIHHQAIGELGSGLLVAARAEDGVIEAIEFADSHAGFFLGIQWHPEWLPEDRVSRLLYARLVRECADYGHQGFQDVQ